MRDWLLSLLQCTRCNSPGLERSGSSCVCRSCEARFPLEEDIADFLGEPHPAVEKEIAAVASLDSHASSQEDRLRALLEDLDSGNAKPDDPRLKEFPSFLEFFSANRRTREMLHELPPAPDSIVVELGADHCLLSGALLDAGCRVIAVDITDHLRFAPRWASEDLCRIRADMNRLPIADNAVNLVWATACVHHSWSLERTFREVRRVLANNGRFVLLSEPMPAWPRYLMFGLGAGFGREQRGLGINENLHRRGKWLEAARRAGFEPRLELPAVGRQELAAKLDKYRLPGALAPLLRRLAGPLQVSIHMVAETSVS